MDEENEKPKQEEGNKEGVPFEIRKGAEYHKPPNRDDDPPSPSPPAKEASDKD